MNASLSTTKRGLKKTCYTAQRSEMLHLIPRNAKCILDVGCARGYLGKSIKATRVVEIVGIEIDRAMAEEAARYLDRVFNADVEDFMLSYPPGYFDCIVFADILEHLVDPWRVLAQYVPYLSAEGLMVLSIPNVQHYSVIGRLLLGEWDYQESGILDNTHLRFFTLKSIKALLGAANLQPVQIDRIHRARPIAKCINRICFNRLEMFLTQQYVVQARKAV